MNFVANLEECLRDLGAEARKKHPGVKEASERGIYKLRTLQNSYVSAVRKASSGNGIHPTTQMFQSQDLLHPFLLATNYPNASFKLLDISFKAMRLLMEANAIFPNDSIHMVRVWTIQAQVVVTNYQKNNNINNNTIRSGNHHQQNHHRNSLPIVPMISTTTTINTGGNDDATNNDANTASTSSSWFGSFIGGTASSTASSMLNVVSETALPKKSLLMNAVSSSSGQGGQQFTAANSKDMERLALEILSSLLQLLELMKTSSSSQNQQQNQQQQSHNNHSNHNNCDIELWTQSVSLCCLLLYFTTKTVQQAARSTLPQVLNLLIPTCPKLQLSTWDDLLSLCSYNDPTQNPPILRGAFSQCKWAATTIVTNNATTASNNNNNSNTPLSPNSARHNRTISSSSSTTTSQKPAIVLPPSPEFAFELMISIIQEYPDFFSSSNDNDDTNNNNNMNVSLSSSQLIKKTLQVTISLLKQSIAMTYLNLEQTRFFQWTLILLQTQTTKCPKECRELLLNILEPIANATEACRNHHDFEDGFCYELRKVISSASSQSKRGGSISGSSSASNNNNNDNIVNLIIDDNTAAAGNSINASAVTIASPTNSGQKIIQSTTGVGAASLSTSSSSVATATTASSSSSLTASTKNILSSTASLIPPNTLWKAGLALEIIFQLLLDQNSNGNNNINIQLLFIDDDDNDDNDDHKKTSHATTTIGRVTETLSDFCTIGASCRGHMMQLIHISNHHRDNSNISYIVPHPINNSDNNDEKEETLSLFHKAETATAMSASGYITEKDSNYYYCYTTTKTNTSNSKNTNNNAILINSENNNNIATSNTGTTTATTTKQQLLMGEALWRAFNSILQIIEHQNSFQYHCEQNDKNENNNGGRNDNASTSAFAPCLAAIQHIIKRFPSSRILTGRSLKGYAGLAQLCMSTGSNTSNVGGGGSSSINSAASRTNASSELTAVWKNALLTSLCKLSVPLWGKRDASCQLKDHHVQALICLLRIVHLYYDSILTEWYVVLETLEELSCMAIASPFLSDESTYQSALSISAIYGRLAPFSTLFTNESVQYFIDALAKICMSVASGSGAVADYNDTNNTATSGSTTENSTAGNNMDSRMNSSSNNKSTENSNYYFTGKESIGEKLVSFGVRAILGAPAPAPTSNPLPTNNSSTAATPDLGASPYNQYELCDVPIARRTKNSYYQDYHDDFMRRLEQGGGKTNANVSGSSGSVKLGGQHQQQLPFALALLADVATTNHFRYTTCGITIARHLCQLATKSKVICPFVMDTLAMLITSRVSAASMSSPEWSNSSLSTIHSHQSSYHQPFQSPGRLLFDNPKENQFFAVEASFVEDGNHDDNNKYEAEILSQAELLSPLCQCIQVVQSPDVAEAALEVLKSVLESVGHTLTEGQVWSVIVDAVTSLSGEIEERSSLEWSNCGILAFRCLKLIVDDFSHHLPTDSKSISLLDCCASFGSSRHDVNTSLTAIGLLWTIADQDGGGGTNTIDRALSKLAFLSTDSRPEVRNCAVNTLFSCIVGRGQSFTVSQWESCLCETLVGIYDRITTIWKVETGELSESATIAGEEKTNENNKDVATGRGSNKNRSRYKVNVHHSRDSAGKQWITTQVLVLRGLNRVLRTFFDQLVDYVDEELDQVEVVSNKNVIYQDIAEEGECNEGQGENEEDDDCCDEEGGDEDEEEDAEEEKYGEDKMSEVEEVDGMVVVDEVAVLEEEETWFVSTWNKIIDYACDAASQDGGRDTLDLRICAVELLVLCNQLSCKAGIQAAITPARVSTNMQVVNGALKSMGGVTGGSSQSPHNYKRSISKVSTLFRENLFLDAFESLESYQDFLETDFANGNDEPESLYYSESTTVQVLHKFIVSLCSLYECCKDHELSVVKDEEVREQHLFERYLMSKNDNAECFRTADKSCNAEIFYVDGGTLEYRFVGIVATVAKVASGGERARFLTPAQRGSIDLLRLMVSNGSSEALLKMVVLGRDAFFCQKSPNHGKDPAEKNGPDLVSFEAAGAVSEEISNDRISDVSKVLTLCQILSTFVSENASSKEKSDATRKRHNYNYIIFVPIMVQGLQSSSRLKKSPKSANANGKASGNDNEKDHDRANQVDLTKTLWHNTCSFFSIILSPVPITLGAETKELSRIPRESEIIELINSVGKCDIPQQYCGDLCNVISSGASESIEVAKVHANSIISSGRSAVNKSNTKVVTGNEASGNPSKSEAPLSEDSKHIYSESLKLFIACFSTVCSIKPDYPVLHAVAERVLKAAFDVFGGGKNHGGGKRRGDYDHDEFNVDFEAALLICKSLKEIGQNAEPLVISLFPFLCNLVGTENSKLRQAVAGALSVADVAQVLAEAQARYEKAEKRAEEAERKAEGLTSAILDLQLKNETLQRQVAASSASSAFQFA